MNFDEHVGTCLNDYLSTWIDHCLKNKRIIKGEDFFNSIKYTNVQIVQSLLILNCQRRIRQIKVKRIYTYEIFEKCKLYKLIINQIYFNLNYSLTF